MLRRRLISLLALVTLISLAIAAHRVRSSQPPEVDRSMRQPIHVLPVATPLRSRALDPVQNIRFTIYPEGIFPREITVQKGLVSIVVEDRTRKTEGLRIEREVGNGRVPVGQIKAAQNFWRGRDQLRLQPGDYQVFDASKPSSRARLIVSP